MVSVMKRVKEVKQPRGGYIRPKDFTILSFDDGKILHEDENIHSSLIGMAVDYLSRFLYGTSLEDAFKISIRGALKVNEFDYAEELLKGIIGLDDTSIVNACKLVGYDVAFRSGIAQYKPVKNIHPNEQTIENIRTMVERSRVFNEKYRIIKDGFTFEGGYTDIITTGDGDFLTENTLWDFKVTKTNPTNKHTLQLLVYYLMGKQSKHDFFDNIDSIGIFNPRLNNAYTLDIDAVPKEVIDKVAHEVIGY